MVERSARILVHPFRVGREGLLSPGFHPGLELVNAVGVKAKSKAFAYKAKPDIEEKEMRVTMNATTIKQQERTRKRVCILGGGFAGVYTAQYLERALKGRDDFEIVLINKENYFVFQPMLAEVVSGAIGHHRHDQPAAPPTAAH